MSPTAGLIQPNSTRVFSAFMLTPIVSAAAYASVSAALNGQVFWRAFILLLLGVYPTILLLGVPAYFGLRHLVRATAAHCAIVGALLASALVLVVTTSQPKPNEAFVYGHFLIVNGAFTGWGWYYLMLNSIKAALFGAFAAVVFWSIAVGERSKLY